MRLQPQQPLHRVLRPRRAATLFVAAALCGLAGCGGDGAGDGSTDDVPGPPSADSTRSPARPAPDTAALPAPDTAPADEGDTAPTDQAPTTPADEGAGAPAPTEGRPAEPSPWSAAGPWVGGAPGGAATQVAVRAGGHDGFDRLVLVFADRVPEYALRRAEGPLHQCGSGRPIEVAAPQVLQLRLRSAQAHNRAGNATVQERSLEPGLTVLRSARLTCDFEGEVEWVIGVAQRGPIRTFTLEGPNRLVIDFRRP